MKVKVIFVEVVDSKDLYLNAQDDDLSKLTTSQFIEGIIGRYEEEPRLILDNLIFEPINEEF